VLVAETLVRVVTVLVVAPPFAAPCSQRRRKVPANTFT